MQHWLSVLVVCCGGIKSKSSDSIDPWNSCKLNVSLNVCLAFGPGKKRISTSLYKIKNIQVMIIKTTKCYNYLSDESQSTNTGSLSVLDDLLVGTAIWLYSIKLGLAYCSVKKKNNAAIQFK